VKNQILEFFQEYSGKRFLLAKFFLENESVAWKTIFTTKFFLENESVAWKTIFTVTFQEMCKKAKFW
jgi:hypothetical protein